MKFETIVKRINEIGGTAKINPYLTGYYYDGITCHGFAYNGIFAEIPYETANTFERMIKRFKHIVVESVYIYGACGYMITTDSDNATAKAAKKTATEFLDAFWQTIHDDPTARENNAIRAVNAGRAAIGMPLI